MNAPKLLTVALAAATLLACRIPNEDHCGRRDGDATCMQLNPDLPYCSICEAENDGCVASLADVTSECRPADTAIAGTESETTDTETTDTETTDTETDAETATETGNSPECGNGIKEEGEACDGRDFGDDTCSSPYELPEGMLACFPNCTIDSSGCCLEAGEVCSNDDECCEGTCDTLITNECGPL